jgi:hypothetical protein
VIELCSDFDFGRSSVVVPSLAAYNFPVSDWAQVLAQGVLFAAFLAANRYFTDGWAGEIRFRRPSKKQLKSDIPFFLFQGAFFGIFSVFQWRAFHGTPLLALLLLFGVFGAPIGFAVLRSLSKRLGIARHR